MVKITDVVYGWSVPTANFLRSTYGSNLVFCYNNCSDLLREHFFLVKLEFFWDTEGPRSESRKSFANSRLKVENL